MGKGITYSISGRDCPCCGCQERIVGCHGKCDQYKTWDEKRQADQYIEKTVYKIGRQYQVTVATSDGLEQVIIMGQGAHRISAQGLKKEIEDTERNARAQWHEQRQSSKTYLFEHMPEEFQAQMEKIRLGEAGEE